MTVRDAMEPSADEQPIVFWQAHARYLGMVVDPPRRRWPGFALLLPGSGPQNIDGQIGPNRFLLQLASGLASRGVTSVRFGKTPLSNPGTVIADTYDHEYVEPATRFLAELELRRKVSRPLAIVGHSLGGHVAPLVAARVRTAGIATINAHYTDLCTVLEWQLQQHAIAGVDAAAVSASLSAAMASDRPPDHDPIARYLWHARHYSADEAFRAVAGVQMLAIGCLADAQVPERELTLWADAARRQGLEVETREYAALNHLGIPSADRSPIGILVPGTISDELLDGLANWIASLSGGR